MAEKNEAKQQRQELKQAPELASQDAPKAEDLAPPSPQSVVGLAEPPDASAAGAGEQSQGAGYQGFYVVGGEKVDPNGKPV